MNHEEPPTERADLLVSQLIDGQLSAEEAAELNALVRSDAGSLERAVDQLLLDSLLTEELGAEPLTALVDLVADPATLGDAKAQAERTSSRGAWLTGTSRRLWKPAGWFGAAAVVLVAVFLIGRWQSTALASPTALVRAAIETHGEPVERVYVVSVEPKPPSDPGSTPPRDVRIATQGDQFWVEMTRGETRWVWGRDLDGAIWLTIGSRWAIRIEPDEIGPWLQFTSDVYSLELTSLLNNVLENCRLEYSSGSESTHVITATPGRRWRGRVRQITIECDKETRAIRRLVVQREMPQQGVTTTIFTLVDSRAADASRYQPEGHLAAPQGVLSRHSHDKRRREILANWFGREVDRWIKPLPGKPK